MTAGDATTRAAISELARRTPLSRPTPTRRCSTAGAGVAVLTQADLQTLLWHGPPMKWLTDAEHHRRAVRSAHDPLFVLTLDRLPVAEEFVVLVVAAVAAAEVGEVGDELHTFDPLHLLEAELGLVA